jgi:hypothetical protein
MILSKILHLQKRKNKDLAFQSKSASKKLHKSSYYYFSDGVLLKFEFRSDVAQPILHARPDSSKKYQSCNQSPEHSNNVSLRDSFPPDTFAECLALRKLALARL